jgi:hypothetical protein
MNDLSLLKENKNYFIEILKSEYEKNVKIETFNHSLPWEYLSCLSDDFYFKCVNDFKSNAVNIIRNKTKMFGRSDETNIYFDEIKLVSEIVAPLENNQNIEIKFYATENNIERFKKVMLIPTKLNLTIKNLHYVNFVKEIADGAVDIELKMEKDTLIIEGNKFSVILYWRFFTEIIANKIIRK